MTANGRHTIHKYWALEWENKQTGIEWDGDNMTHNAHRHDFIRSTTLYKSGGNDVYSDYKVSKIIFSFSIFTFFSTLFSLYILRFNLFEFIWCSYVKMCVVYSEYDVCDMIHNLIAWAKYRSRRNTHTTKKNPLKMLMSDRSNL